MLTCRACMKRCLQTLIGESTLAPTSRGSSAATNQSRRNYSSRTIQKTSPPGNQRSIARKPNFTSHKPENGFKKGAVSTSYQRQQWLESRGVTPINKRVERTTDDDLLMKKQLRYLKDPLKLAAHVRQVLRDDDCESALALVRAASKDTHCVVSWNHIIDWQLSRQKMNGAIKTYNEMKKRAQTPDAYTYTIIFRGCAEHPMPNQALGKVITIYNSMLADKSPIKPNTIHLNAVLKMCANAGNMEALFSIASQLPTKGIRAANNLTYTIILNAIRLNTFVTLRGNLTPVQQRKNRQKANLDARLLWQDITKRWWQGDIAIDEELVCTMGRVLLLGTDRDIDDILSLIEQTMGIPRQTTRQASPEGREMDQQHRRQPQEGVEVLPRTIPAHKVADLPPATSSISDEDKAAAIANEPETGEEFSVTLADPFRTPDVPKNVSRKAIAFFPKPGQNTLSLLMSALLDLDRHTNKGNKGPAANYWNILTKEYQVEPDADNYHGYLRILRVARSSTEVVQLLLKMPQSYMEIKTFRIAMSTCMRDKNNQHAFSNAGKVLDLMQTRLQVPDFSVLDTYLDLACSSTTYNAKVSSVSQQVASKTEKGKQVLRALYRINPSYTNLRSLMAYGDPTKPKATSAEEAALRDAVLNLTQRMVSAYDLLMNKAMVDRSMYTQLTKERSKLAAFITRYKGHKDGIVRSSLNSYIAKESGRVLRRTRNPELHRKTNLARNRGEEAYSEVQEKWAGRVSGIVDEEKGPSREKHFEQIMDASMKKFAEEERKAAEDALTWRIERTPESRQTV